MATNKAKRSIPSAQPERRRLHPETQPHPTPPLHSQPRPHLEGLYSQTQTQPEGFIPVKSHVYRTIAELNGGFEQVLRDLETLGRISLFRSGSATAVHSLISRARAQINQEFALTLHDREMANAGYFERLFTNAASAANRDGRPRHNG